MPGKIRLDLILYSVNHVKSRKVDEMMLSSKTFGEKLTNLADIDNLVKPVPYVSEYLRSSFFW